MENHACQGGYLTKAWDYIQNTGIVGDICYPYTSGGGEVAACYTTCPGSGSWLKHKSKEYHTYTDEDSIKQEIYANGPI